MTGSAWERIYMALANVAPTLSDDAESREVCRVLDEATAKLMFISPRDKSVTTISGFRSGTAERQPDGNIKWVHEVEL